MYATAIDIEFIAAASRSNIGILCGRIVAVDFLLITLNLLSLHLLQSCVCFGVVNVFFFSILILIPFFFVRKTNLFLTVYSLFTGRGNVLANQILFYCDNNISLVFAFNLLPYSLETNLIRFTNTFIFTLKSNFITQGVLHFMYRTITKELFRLPLRMEFRSTIHFTSLHKTKTRRILVLKKNCLRG